MARAMNVFRFMLGPEGLDLELELLAVAAGAAQAIAAASPNPMKASGTPAMLIALAAVTVPSDSTWIGRALRVLVRTGVSASSSIVQLMPLNSICAPPW